MKKSEKQNIGLICYAIVLSNFASMINIKNRGANFSWYTFAEKMEKKCSIYIWLHIPIPSDKKKHAEIEKLAKEYGFQIASPLASIAGLI